MKQSLWDLKQFLYKMHSRNALYFEAVPMGFETTPIGQLEWEGENFEAVPMGFETEG